MNMMNVRIMMILLVTALLGLAGRSAAQDNYALLLQSSPPDAGNVSPGLGVHEIQVGQTVALSAAPKPGYRFAYWLGDVSSASVSDTSVSIDSPKMVVAVFVREEFDEKLPGAGIIQDQISQVNYTGQRAVALPVSSPRSPNPGYDYNPRNNIVQSEDDNQPTDPLVPGDKETDPLVPGDNDVPEPATILLLGMGGLLLRRKRQ